MHYSTSHKGTPPKDADGVIYDSPEDPEHPLHGWRIYRRALSVAPWVSLKLARMSAGPGAANYWLGWHTTEKRFSRTSCVARMPAAMLEAVREVMTDWYPTLTDEQIRAYGKELDAEIFK